MKNDDPSRDLSRRGFLRGAGLIGLGGAVAAVGTRVSPAATLKPAPQAAVSSGYDLERFRKTDPALLQFVETGRLKSPYEEPKRIVIGPDGTLWLTAREHIVGLDKQGAKVADWTAAEEVHCLAVAPDGALHAGLLNHVEVFDRQGRRLAKWKSPGPRAWLTSIAAGENDVFVSDAGDRLVYRFDRAGNMVGRLGEKDPARDIPAFVVPSPYFDLEIGRDGYLWVANPGFHQLQAFTFDGTLEKKWGEASFAIEGFCGCCNPSYFTRLAEGGFVTSEKGLPRVKVYSADGKFESVVAGPEAFPKYLGSPNATPIPMDVAEDAAGRIYVADTLGHEVRIYQRKVKT